tara:strand:- start:687 stop:956 length:270 start_codon:yes stop_codon:yes gene_type:complete
MPTETQFFELKIKEEVMSMSGSDLEKNYVELRCKLPNLTDEEELQYWFISERLMTMDALPDSEKIDDACKKTNWMFLLIPIAALLFWRK